MSDFRKIKLQVLAVLKSPDWEKMLDSLLDIPSRKIIGPLFSLLLHPPEIKWRTVTLFGLIVSALEKKNRSEALAVMRRLLWNMQRNSSNSGWGVSECMGEVMAQSENMVKKFHNQLISYIQNPRCFGSGNNYIEHPQLRQMAYWGIGRLSEARPWYVSKAVPDLLQALLMETEESKAFICWILGSLREKKARNILEELSGSTIEVDLYRNRILTRHTLGELAGEALEKICSSDFILS
jgi:hypothetical protein